jgi:hypothetical protein
MPLTLQSGWWLAPVVPLSLFLVHAMMSHTASLMAKRPPARRHAVAEDVLRRRLAELEAREGFGLAPDAGCDLALRFPRLEPEWCARFARVWVSSRSTLRLLLDAERREVRLNETGWSAALWLGFERGRLLSGSWSFTSGPAGPGRWRATAYGLSRAFPPRVAETRRLELDAGAVHAALERTVLAAGWTLRPAVLWWDATYRGLRLARLLTPPGLRRLSARALWSLLHPLAYAALIAYLVAVGGAETLARGDVALLAGISAAWWAVWALIAWLLCGAPRFWRRARR